MLEFFRSWDGLLDGPVFVFTSDQDWAPEWALEEMWRVARSHGAPLHVFRTNPSPFLDGLLAQGLLTQGWHPNFMPGSSQGATASEVIGYCRTHFPGACTVRTHCYCESTPILGELVAAGIVADSQVVTRFQPSLVPLLHATGLIRLPVFFEDDIFYDDRANGLDLGGVVEALFTPGLKILDVHATFVACNTPHRQFHEDKRQEIFGTDSPRPGVRWSGRGTADVVNELLDTITGRGGRFVGFEELVGRLRAALLRQGWYSARAPGSRPTARPQE